MTKDMDLGVVTNVRLMGLVCTFSNPGRRGFERLR